MQILVPIAGQSAFFSRDHYFFPKPLIEVGGRPMIELVTENLLSIDRQAHFIFVTQREDVARFSLDRTLRLLVPEAATVVALAAPTGGALCSALMAIDHIDAERPLIICNGDQVIDADLGRITSEFVASGADAGTIVFDSVHPRWSYVDLADNGQVKQAAEKQVISRNAIAGFYYFKSGRTFITAAFRSIENEASVDGSFFLAPSLNEIILAGGSVISHRVKADQYHSFYTPERIGVYAEAMLRRSLERRLRTQPSELRVVIPAAGEGSRFKAAGHLKPKPFIDVQGKPMLERVIDNVAPSGAKVHLLLRAEHVAQEEAITRAFSDRGYRIHHVERLTEGTACTLLLARAEFDDDQPVLVANSDQLVDFDVGAFVRDCFDRGLDGSILVFEDSTRNPKWSFAKVDQEGLVTEVAEKKAISNLATVGIYLFTRGADFVKAAIDMIARNDRVNGEFYTCPVYNYMLQMGLRIGVYQISEKSMHGVGTPEDLDTFLALRANSV